MEYPETLEFKIDGLKPVSTNEMYSYGRKIVRKSNKYKAFESEVMIQIRNTSDIMINGFIDKFKNRLDSDYRLAIRGYFEFYIPKRSYFRTDTSNYIKATEDIIKNLIGIDDSRNVSIVADKYLSGDKEWHIKVRLTIFELSYEIPKDKWSRNILGNTKSSSKIKSRIKPIKTKAKQKKSNSTKTNTRYKSIIKDKTKAKQDNTTIELTDNLEEESKNNSNKSIRVDKNVEIILLV